MVAGGDARGARPGLLNNFSNNGDTMAVLHDINHPQPHHALPSTHIHHGPHLHGHDHGRYGVRLDANWGFYGQTGEVMKEVKTLNERLEELKQDVENLKTNKDEGGEVSSFTPLYSALYRYDRPADC